MSVLLNTVVRSVDVMVLNDIIEQAAGRPVRAGEQGGKYSKLWVFLYRSPLKILHIPCRTSRSYNSALPYVRYGVLKL